jgi:glycosyltransferase involved in cell wall biosynthesis
LPPPGDLLTRSPRRLLSVGHSYVIGANRALAHAVQRAAGDDWEVRVLTPRYFHGRDDLRPAAFSPRPDEPCPVVPIPAYLTRFVHIFGYGLPSLRRAMSGSWDIVHAWEEPYILAGAELAACAPRSARFVFRTAQSLDKWYPPPFNLFERYTLKRAAGWICSGRLVAENLGKRSRYASRPMACIPLGVDTTIFRPDPAARADALRLLGWEGEGPPVVGFLGRFVPEKGLGVLMAALDQLQTNWRALFIGGGKLEGELRAWSARYPNGRVRILTDVAHDRVAPYLSAMDVLAAPSLTTRQWKEQFGRMLIEGMACGVAVAGSDSGEIPHVIGGAGEVVPEASISSWTGVLGTLLENRQRRAELGELGRERAETCFAWPIIGRQHLQFFERILEGETQPHR